MSRPRSSMSTAGLSPPDEHAAAADAAAEIDDADQDLRGPFSRTPRPYHHDGQEVLQDLPTPQLEAPQGHSNDRTHTRHSKTARHNDSSRSRHKSSRGQSRQASRAGSESGSEADDERPSFVKALPPSLLRPRKGLKTGEKDEDALLTPAQLDDEGRPLPLDYFEGQVIPAKARKEEDEAERDVLRRRRYAEFLRRMSEVALMIGIVLCVLCGRGVLRVAWRWKLELLSHALTIITLIIAYPIKLSIVDEHARPERLLQRFRVPASFDPATVLYPPLLPLLVALSVSPNNHAVILPNIILGLSSLPQRLFPRSSRLGGFNPVHWLVSVVPLVVAEKLSKHSLPETTSTLGLSAETLVSLYPLHHALLSPLHYLTTTSLLISELHLLAAALINLLLLVSSPQASILKACLWIGGVIVLAVCGPVLRWNLTLVRVPKWKLRRPGSTAEERRSLIDAVTNLINLQRAASAFRSPDAVESDADEDQPDRSLKRRPSIMPRLNTAGLVFPSFNLNAFSGPTSAVEPRQPATDYERANVQVFARPRRNTVPEREVRDMLATRSTSRKKSRHSHIQWYLQLTPDQAFRRRWLYAGFTYTVFVVAILGPVREYMANSALQQHEPIGWALGYLFGDIPLLRSIVKGLGLDGWVLLPETTSSWTNLRLQLPLHVDEIRGILGAGNVRLLIVGYWAIVLLVGLLTVFALTAYVEVDTRRKVFHGVMVAMLLPAIFIDPCYCALALSMALAVFLLLEAVRAGQVPPLGSAISRFVAPYVDGRDLRGPVVVSHLFLLIGCAVPLWFSLASLPRSGDWPWNGWELADGKRETAMVAGVVCVGMGDAAASLIGRRYGRHKWLWVGGKSLEGSAAFAAAVTIGLLAAKAWLVFGGWNDEGRQMEGESLEALAVEWTIATVKAAFCACGASFMEAVLTGANDNVVVPIALWLLVKGIRL